MHITVETVRNWYLQVLIDLYSKFPVVTVHDMTGWLSLKPALDKTLHVTEYLRR